MIEYQENLKEIIQLGRRTFANKKFEKVSEWATKRMLTKEETARPGYWSNDVTPFAVEIMDAFTDRNIERITGMFSAQVVKTEILKNFIGYVIDQDPASMLLIYPSDGDARDFSVEKLEPLFRANEFISNKVAPAKSNSKDNKTLFKKFYGGYLAITGSRVPQDLARRSVKYVFADDRDRIGEAGDEGDAVALAWQRTESYALLGRKLVEFSTPTIKGESPIERAYELSDQRKYYVPCPFCEQLQVLEFENLVWEKEYDLTGEVIRHLPDTVRYKCQHCEQLIDENYKFDMIKNGVWIAKYPERIKHRGYWLNRLYSLFSSWSNIVEEFLEKKNDKSELQVFYNTVLGKTFEREDIEELKSTGLLERCEDYLTNSNPFIPNEVLFLVMGVDTQPDRLEYQIIGVGKQFELWVLEYDVLYGDTDQEDVYNTLENIVLTRKFTRKDVVEIKFNWKPGLHYPIFIDSGGRNTNSVYKQCKKRALKGWIAVKGVGGEEKPILLNRSIVGHNKDTQLQNIGVDAVKSLLHKMIKTNMSPMKIHFTSAYCNYEYFTQLTNEHAVKELNKKTNRFHWTWKKKSEHARVEVLDTLVYALAAAMKLNPKFELIEKNLLEQKNETKVTEIENNEIEKETLQHKKVRRLTLARRRI